MAVCIQISNLTKCYGPVVAVGGLSLDIEQGEVVGLLGPNGAGKSTTLHMLSGLCPATSGGITVFGKDLHASFLDVAPRMGVLVERPAFYDYMSARRNLLLLASLSRREVAVDQALDRVGLLYAANRRVGGFSQGMRQRLGIAQALMTEPELLILDEPANSLDAESAQDVLRMLRALASEARVTIVVASHMLHEVETLCNRVAILNRGRLVACEPTDSLLSYDQSQVDLLVDAPGAAARHLRDQEWVESAEQVSGRVAVRLTNANVHQLTAFLVSGGFKLSGVIPRRRTLRDYFLKVLNS